MDKSNKLTCVLSQLDDCLDALNYELRRNFAEYSEDDYNLLKNSILDLSEGFRTLSNIIIHD